MTKYKKYHTPDDRWETFGITNFDQYCEHAVVEGLFHDVVPTDVKQAYEIAQQMMAYAWYTYPLYDEAFSKMLRIIEMAVKIRCKQLNIHPQAHERNNRKVTLKGLMDTLIKAEPAKQLPNDFTVARSLRNAIMHPHSHTYSGPLSKDYILQSVALLNKLFLPETLFIEIDSHLQTLRTSLANNSDALIVKCKDGNYLAERITIEAAICLNHSWRYLLVAHPVVLNIADQLKQKIYYKPFIFYVGSIRIVENEISATDLESGLPILVRPSRHPKDQQAYSHFLTELESAPIDERTMLRHSIGHEIDRTENKFWYHHLHLVNITTNEG